jgi:hypothetical protein
VREKPDLILAVCCAASLILVPLFVIGGTLVLFTIAVTGEIADSARGREAVFADRPHHRARNVPRTLSDQTFPAAGQPIEGA